MLSRSNSAAASGYQLRRAKSTSSARSATSGHLRNSTSTDPFISREQAELAAVEAYQRAREYERLMSSTARPAAPKPQRRKSQVTGKAQGDHFEDARLGRRRSTSKKGSGGLHKVCEQTKGGTDASEGGNGIVPTGKRFMIAPRPQAGAEQHDVQHPSTTSRVPRRSNLDYSDGSPLQRFAGSSVGSTARVRNWMSSPAYKHSESFGEPLCAGVSIESPASAIQLTSEQPQSCASFAAAIGDGPSDSAQSDTKLRERKSFMLAPFQRKKPKNVDTNASIKYDTTLPPYNFAHEMPPPPLPPTSLEVTRPVVIGEVASRRGFSISVKERFMKVFRKSSNTSAGLPPQQVTARYSYYTTDHSTSFRERENGENAAEDSTLGDAEPHPAHNQTSIDEQNIEELNSARTRLTVGSFSTAAGTWSTRNESEIGDDPRPLTRSGSTATLRKASSIIGRSLKGRFRQPSRANLQSSEESAELFSALKERILPNIETDSRTSAADDGNGLPTSALATLPSQQIGDSATLARNHRYQPTIRSVTPEPSSRGLDIPSPVTEVFSPAISHLSVPEGSVHRSEESHPTPGSQLRRRLAVKAPTPSREQIAKRIERSQNRWQSPLEDTPVISPKPKKAFTTHDNPYEPPSLNKAVYANSPGDGLPHHTRAEEKSRVARGQAQSPSVYSRGTDEATSRAASPSDFPNTMITITSREVRRYSISPAKKPPVERHISNSSQDWRRWLSNEMSGWRTSTGPDNLGLAGPAFDNESTNEADCGDGQNVRTSTPPLMQAAVNPTKSVNPTCCGNEQRPTETIPQPRYTEYPVEGPSPSAGTDAGVRKSIKTTKTKSALELRANYKRKASSTARPLIIHRKSSDIEAINILEDKTIQNISAGPYAHGQFTSFNTSSQANKENTPPREPTNLPVLTSSEWLSAGAKRTHGNRAPSSPSMARNDRMVSRRFPSHSPGTGKVVGESSPGQKLATSWLDGKRWKESSPAFV